MKKLSWVLSLLATTTALADGAPQEVQFSGYLEEAGSPVDGQRSVTLRLWDDATATAPANRRCEVALANLAVARGQFQVPLSASCLTALAAQPNLWSEITVGEQTHARVKMKAAPFALEAARASDAAGALKARLDKPSVSRNGVAISLGATYCGATAQSAGRLTSGTFTGYRAGKAMCEATCASATAHMCTAEEVVRTYSLGGSITTAGWYSTGVQGASAIYFASSAARFNDDCVGWTDTTTGNTGPIWVSPGYPDASPCSTAREVLCCD